MNMLFNFIFSGLLVFNCMFTINAMMENEKSEHEIVKKIFQLLEQSRRNIDEGKNDCLCKMLFDLKPTKKLICISNENGYTPLQIAAQLGNLKLCNTLLKLEADVNYKTKSGVTALHLGAYWKNDQIIKLLVEKGADINALCSRQFSVLHYACYLPRTNIEELINIIIKAGCTK